MQTNLQSGLEIETTEFATCFGTWDQREGMGAFVAKRQPEPFQGR
jgi:enoyl-CoA hydratase/carnithine racemase